MKTLYIHAGMPKCGSSALQVFFANNIEFLNNESVDYFNLEDLEGARKGNITSGNGALLSRSLLGEGHEAYLNDDGSIYNRFFDAIKNSEFEKGLVSSEFFAVVPFKRLNSIKEELAEIGVETKFIYYVRRQDQFLMSSYMQRVKRHGFTGMPEDFIANTYEHIHFLKYFGYANELEGYLGKGNVLPFNYDDTKSYQNGLIGHFMKQVLDYDADWIKVDPVVNVSPSPVELKMMMVANQYGARAKLSDFLVEDSVKAGRGNKFKQHAILNPCLQDEILTYFETQNRQFKDKFEISFTAPDVKEFINLEALEIDPAIMTSVLMGLIVRLDRRIAGVE